ncbi:MAG: alanine--tRNA ligase, partial [Clostridia bacterium]|nr:alanine--tRNA ligase [Clostridia bacterium]
EEQGLSVDVEGFNAAMDAQKKAARDAREDGSSWDADATYTFEGAEPTVFIGYDDLKADATVKGIVKEQEVAQMISAGEQGFLVVDKTPFYAEMGGQVGDIGAVFAGDKQVAKVVNTTKTGDGFYMHEIEALEEIKLNDTVTMAVDTLNRKAIICNHSATHLLQQALRDVLGDHVAQAGSFVSADRLRFDFTHFTAMTAEEIEKAEAIVNEKILEAISVSKQEMSIEDAKKTGAKALFGEKYGDVVRVVAMSDYSIEFCGGCHVDNTSEIGLFKLLSENGVSAGVRRIEAVTSKGVLNYLKEKEALIQRTAEQLKANPAEIDLKAASIVSEGKELQKKIDAFREKLAKGMTDNLLVGAKVVGDIRVVTADLGEGTMDELRVAGDQLKDKVQGAAVIVLANHMDDKISFVSLANKEAIALGAHAGMIMKEITAIAGGSGGGKPDSARGGGKILDKVDNALALVDEIIAKQIAK